MKLLFYHNLKWDGYQWQIVAKDLFIIRFMIKANNARPPVKLYLYR
jgi:hypothetical protein